MKMMQDELIQQLKKEVKQIVEEAVTRKFIHADSTSITSLCAVVDAIIKDGSKRRAGGILPPYDTETFLLKLCEVSAATETLVKKLTGTDVDENAFEVHKPGAEPENEVKKSDVKFKKLNLDQCKLSYGKNIKFLWIRVALVEKLLAKILASLVEHADKFYEPTAILADAVNGPLVANLLDGPCALDYSKMKTPDGRWSDPSADELVQRHRIHSGLSLRRRQISLDKPQLGSTSPLAEEFLVAPSLAREHVESLHQNASANMLFGKNNVEVQPACGSEWVLGYLSLHQTAESLLLKWTPNDVMSGSPDEQQMLHSNEAITIDTLDVVYVHCHHKGEDERVMVLIAQDGVQRPPIRFPTTGSLMRFLECLETGLVPYGRLDPPLANENGSGTLFDKHEGKIVKQSLTRDYVFRLVPSVSPEDIGFDSDLNLWATSKKKSSKKKKLRKLAERPKSRHTAPQRFIKKQGASMTRASLESVCQTMKYQITYRALKGWLSHVRHLSTVRKHLSSLVYPTVFGDDEVMRQGLTREKWSELYRDGKLCSDKDEISMLVYHGGVEQEIRRQVWPYLLGYYKYGSELEERENEDNLRAHEYNKLLKEWANVETILRQRKRVSETDRDSTADSADSKEDDFNETPENDPLDTKNDTGSPNCSSLSNGKLANGYGHNDTPGENISNGTGENSPKSEQDNESGCYDCLEESGNVPNAAYENGPSYDKCTLCSNTGSASGDDVAMTNGYYGNDGDDDVGKTKQYTYKKEKRASSSRINSYSDDLLDNFDLNIHRIDKDVLRCDRNYPYFTNENLEKLRRIMCTYVWTTLDVGYVQGMCDLLAPLLVIFDDEAKSYHCFVLLMKRMDHNFPHGENMDKHFANMRSLIQILDAELFEVMQQNGDLTHCYFCYRWFLLDFKREFLYEDIFRVWECIWSAHNCSSKHFVLFIALALLKSYRNILIDHSMDFTDIIKFFNEMAERHNATQILDLARSSVRTVATLIQNE